MYKQNIHTHGVRLPSIKQVKQAHTNDLAWLLLVVVHTLEVSPIAMSLGGMGFPGASGGVSHCTCRFLGQRARAPVPVRDTPDR